MEAMSFVRSFGVGCDEFGVVDIGPFPSFLRGFFAGADKLVARPFQFETCPIVRNRLYTVSLKHVSFGRGQGMRDRVLLSQMGVETLHQIERRRIFDSPERGNHSPRAR